MSHELLLQPSTSVEADWIILPVLEGEPLSAMASALDTALSGGLSRLQARGDVTGKLGEVVKLLDPQGISARRIAVVGLGERGKLTPARLMRALTTVVRDVCRVADQTVAVVLPVFDSESSSQTIGSLSISQRASIVATALKVGTVTPALYQAKPERFAPKQMSVVLEDESLKSEVQAGLARGGILGDCMNLTRELVNRHPGEVYPESFADRAAQLAITHNLECDILDESRLRAERMHSLLGVAQGSTRPPRVVVLKYRGAGDTDPTLALVGKGVTFDSGGLSLKTSDGMKTMKADMAGAATALGALCAIAKLELPVNVTAYLGLVENMPSGNSYKLGEVLTARNGVTIEVMNTDAEGRLVLADVLSYAVDQGVDRIIDLATLTGSCVVALGEDVAGLFPNNAELEQAVHAAASRAGEEVWSMPMFDAFGEQLRSDVADCQNIGTRWGGSITAAKFLEKFVGNTPWVHLDIAGPAFAESAKPHRDPGATASLLRTLVELATPSW
ncbi:MAG: leucyl aminopeptidase [Planctomycetaceae bacterium]